MKIGIFLPHIGEQATRENIVYTAREAENGGIDSVWALDRLLWPLNPQTPYVASPDGSLPVEYQNVLDPLTTLTFVAGITERISLGTSIIDMFFQNPVVLGKRFATLDVLSRGRVIAGLGLGWSKDEYEVSGIPYKERGSRADEYLQVLRKIWAEDVVEFSGQFYKIPASKIAPKPLQKPHPPLMIGGFSPKIFSRIVKYTQGWIGAAGFGPLNQLEQQIIALKEVARKLDKDPSKVGIYMVSYPTIFESSASNESRTPMTGTIDQIGSDIEQLKTIGTDHLILGHIFSPLTNDVRKMVEVTKQLARFAK
jgi:probable F420-dependent oxidoreductase